MVTETSEQDSKSNITLMFHDVYKMSPKESGIRNKMTDYYKIKVEKFKHLVEQICDNNRITLTFDDGGVSFYTVILPILEELQVKGHFYIPTSLINSEGFLSKEQIIELSKRGHIVGAHSTTHPKDMTKMTFEEREFEWKNSCEILHDILGYHVNEISIPNGYYKNDDVSIFKNLGIKTVYTSNPSDDYFLQDIHFIGRFCIDYATSYKAFDKILNSKLYRFRMGLLFRVKNILKIILGDKYSILKRILRKIQKSLEQH